MTILRRATIGTAVIAAFITLWARAPRSLWYSDTGPTRLGHATTSFMAWYSGLGLPPRRQVALELRGRKTGLKRTLPVVVATVHDTRYLVSMMGERAAWVANARANGVATIRKGRRETVRLVEVFGPEHAPVLREYLRLAPGARPFFPVSKNAPVGDFAAIVDRYPIFRVDSLEELPLAR